MKILKILKSKPVEELDNGYDIDNIYYQPDNNANNNASDGSVSDLYNEFDNDDAGVRIVHSEEPAKIVAEKEPMLKRIFSPKSCQDAQAIVNALKEDRIVVIYLEDIVKSKADMTRLFDYVMGGVQALDATLDRVDRDTVVLWPNDADQDISLDEIEEEVVSEDSDNV